MKTQTRPLQNYVLIHRKAEEGKLIITAETAESDEMHTVIAVRVGPDVEDIKPGDVLKVSGIRSAIAADEENHWLLRATEVAATIVPVKPKLLTAGKS
jgi:co-chaperonin GroES (HSP10)